MKPFSNKILIPLLVAELTLFAFFIAERTSLGILGFILNMIVEVLIIIGTVFAIKTRINWERNQEYQRKARMENNGSV
jgi:hypothetical protein